MKRKGYKFMKKKSSIITVVSATVLLLILSIPISSYAADTTSSTSKYSVTVNNHTELTLTDVVLAYDNQDLHNIEDIKSGDSHTFVVNTTKNQPETDFTISGKTDEGKSFSKSYHYKDLDDSYITLSPDSCKNLSTSSSFLE